MGHPRDRPTVDFNDRIANLDRHRAAASFGVSNISRTRVGGHVRVTNMELFFDLVYVFSIIQLSHFLLYHQTWLGALEAMVRSRISSHRRAR